MNPTADDPNSKKLNPELLFHLRSLTRIIYYVTEEEDRLLKKLSQALSKHEKRTFVFNAAFGLVPIAQVLQDWEQRTHATNADCLDIHRALIRIYTDDPMDQQNFYIITDPERWLVDPHVQRRVLNIIHQLHNDEKTVKILLFVGNRVAIPQKLQRYIEVVHDKGLSDTEYEELIQTVASKLQMPSKPPKGVGRFFKGLTSFEADAAVAQSVVRTRKDKVDPKRVDPRYIGEYKRRQLAKTDLLTYVDTSKFGFDQIGGIQRFKAWAEKTKACWTEEGQRFGLKPPKGVLAVGVWGCGKSLSVKCLGNAWRLPVVQLEMGRLRSSGVGESESNVYRALSLIESVAPCIVWVDEAEKSLAGNQSSAYSDAGTTARTIGILSTWLQETNAQVCLAMTANSLKTLPVEFVNRIQERFFFDLPNEDERIEIIKIHLLKNRQDPKLFQLAELAEAAKNMVGREIEQAIEAGLRDSFHAGSEALDQTILLKEMAHKPRIFKTMVDELREVLEWVGFDPDLNEGVRAKFASDKRSETFRDFKVASSKE